MRLGKLVVIEGVDGSGKATQTKLLLEYLRKTGIKDHYLSFPRYDKFFGKLAKRFIQGEFGKVSPYLASLIFASDRMAARDQLNSWLKEKCVVVIDRYVTASLAHQGAKVENDKQMKFVDWLYRLEYGENMLPREDMVVFIRVPVKMTQKLIKNKDAVEKDAKYQKQSLALYMKLAEKFKHWKVIEGVDSQGRIYSRNKIHEKIVNLLKQQGII